MRARMGQASVQASLRVGTRHIVWTAGELLNRRPTKTDTALATRMFDRDYTRSGAGEILQSGPGQLALWAGLDPQRYAGHSLRSGFPPSPRVPKA